MASNSPTAEGFTIFGLPAEFYLFGLTLIGVALFHRRTLLVSLIGLAAIVGYKIIFTGLAAGPGLPGLLLHLRHEWVILANLLALLLVSP